MALLAGLLAWTAAALAQDGPKAGAEALRALVNALGTGGYSQTSDQISALAATGDPSVAPVLQALADGDLYVREADGAVFIAARAGKIYRLRDPLSGQDAGEAGRKDIDKIKVNNSLRRAIRAALGALTLQAGDPGQRLAAAQNLFKTRDPEALESLDAALAKESDPGVRAAMAEARAALVLLAPPDLSAGLAAVATIAARGDREALTLLKEAAAGQGEVAAAAARAAGDLSQILQVWDLGQNIWYGISLGSVLLLAAIGLSITFGVMGVINMAHGEMVMIGAYTTFAVQELIRTSAPWLFDYSLTFAIPLAFLISGAVGIAIERSVIRWLYGRPLETLLATWGLSLILQQAVRSIFGATNREVGNPSWMSGAFELGQLTITYNRMWIIAFALFVFALLMFVLRQTPLGLQMRAVTQNRQMASAMGIRTPWIDALTFGLGSGIAGIAGVALSQIGNVSPNLGQGYIIDSFMVVVFGGVGNLWGTLVGAFSLGVANKFLEPFAGAVLGKILVLVLIILFIQRYPRGLFAQKGRAVEA